MEQETTTVEPTTNANTRKLNAEDLTAITDLKTKFNELYSNVGLLTIDKNILEVQLENVTAEINSKLELFAQLRQQEEELLASLKNQYGDGQINVVAGTFTPVS